VALACVVGACGRRSVGLLDLSHARPYSPPRCFAAAPSLPNGTDRIVLKTLFTWWNGATPGVYFTAWKRGSLVGQDAEGNRYYEARDARDSYDDKRKRRWVIYKGYAEASKVPPEWHGWLHHTFDEPPTKEPLKRRSWEKDHIPNLTGTVEAWRPAGSIARAGERPHATGDYEAWSPEG
jgi:NADH:ubiquinone oxidoreductase subunit